MQLMQSNTAAAAQSVFPGLVPPPPPLPVVPGLFPFPPQPLVPNLGVPAFEPHVQRPSEPATAPKFQGQAEPASRAPVPGPAAEHFFHRPAESATAPYFQRPAEPTFRPPVPVPASAPNFQRPAEPRARPPVPRPNAQTASPNTGRASQVPVSVSLPTPSVAPGAFAPETNASNFSADALAVASTVTAVSSRDPNFSQVLASLESTELNESALYTLLEQDRDRSIHRHFWQLPPKALIKYGAGRKKWLEREAQLWNQVAQAPLRECIQYFLQLVHRPDNSTAFDVSPACLVSFAQAICTTQLPYKELFKTPGKSWLCNDRVVWQLDSEDFPGPKPGIGSTGQAMYRWFHAGSEASLCGVFKCGRVLRTCNETVGMGQDETPYGFFGRAAFEGSEREMAQLAAQLTLHTKNLVGVLFSGRMYTSHERLDCANTYFETVRLKVAELIKSPSKDKRWAVRESSARLDRIYLTSLKREASDADESWGPNWNELLSATPNRAALEFDG